MEISQNFVAFSEYMNITMTFVSTESISMFLQKPNIFWPHKFETQGILCTDDQFEVKCVCSINSLI